VSDETPVDEQTDTRVEGDASDASAAQAAAIDLEARAEVDPRSRIELLSDLDQIEAQRDEYLDDLRRAHADFENYRKRVARDGAVQREHGRADVVTALLDVLDDLDRVVVAADGLDHTALAPDAVAVASGVRVVADKAMHALAALGIERVDTTGVPFDPTVHDAVQQVDAETDGADVAGGAAVDGPVVHALLRPGYRLPDRVLRPAMVVVAQ
jgi:molecular chaperone GrpE